MGTTATGFAVSVTGGRPKKGFVVSVSGCRPMGTTSDKGFAVSRVRPAGTTTAQGFHVSDGRPIGTTSAAGFNGGKPIGTTVDRGSKNGSSPWVAKRHYARHIIYTTGVGGGCVPVAQHLKVAHLDNLLKHKSCQTQSEKKMRNGKEDEKWGTDESLMNASPAKLKKLKALNFTVHLWDSRVPAVWEDTL